VSTMDRRNFLRNLLVGGASLGALSACGGSSESSVPNLGQPSPTPPVGSANDFTAQQLPAEPEAPTTIDSEVSFLVIGDMGTGNDGQYKVARAMEAVIAERGAQFILATGDNIYEEGVGSVDDVGFLDKFEYPYENIHIPFYLCLGNHDNACTPLGGGSVNKRGNFQVDYHYSTNRLSDKWRMPARYYTHRFGGTHEHPLMELFVVDSNPLTSFYQDMDPAFSWENFGYPQQRWMREQVKKSQAHWKIAMSHVPYLSNAKHGNAGNLDPDLRWLFTSPDADGLRYKLFLEDCFKNQADMLFTGHDHVMQWLKPSPDLGPTEVIVSGAGGKDSSISAADRNPAYFQKGGEYGFVWVSLNMHQMSVRFYGVDKNTGAHHLNYARTQNKPIQSLSPLQQAVS